MPLPYGPLTPLREEFGRLRGTISPAVSVNLLLHGMTAPFASASTDRLGMRGVVSCALAGYAAGLLCPVAALMSVAIRDAGVRPGRREAL